MPQPISAGRSAPSAAISRARSADLFSAAMRKTSGAIVRPTCGNLLSVNDPRSPHCGACRAFVIFWIAGAVGFLVSNLAGGAPSIGASGSIFGLLAALIVYGRRTHHQVLTRQLWQWAILMFVMAFVLSNVNNWAHAGGFAGGWVTAEAMRFHEEKRETPGVQMLALALLLVTVAGFALSFWKVTAALL